MQIKTAGHYLSVEKAVEDYETHLELGLSEEVARARRKENGPNELKEKRRISYGRMFIRQFSNWLIIGLLAAAVVSSLLGEIYDAAAIFAIIILNAFLGVTQEYRAEKSLAALRKLSAPQARVIRHGTRQIIAARDLVPGDIVLLEEGHYVPADLRLIESVNLRVNESALTGESHASEKDASVILNQDVPIGDRANSAFMSTMVAYGRGKGLVTATGMNTQIGLIAQMLESYETEPTPLQKKLSHLGKTLGLAALTICGVVFVWGLSRDTQILSLLQKGVIPYLTTYQQTIVTLFMTAVSLAIAAVPEGLPAVVTICLALGMQRMVKRHALIRHLPAVEALGSATVICSDKTGTLTQNEMTVTRGWIGGSYFDISGKGYNSNGEFSRDNQPFDSLREPDLLTLLRTALLCNDARLEKSGEEENNITYRMVGDPTEGALVVAAAKADLWRPTVEKDFPRVQEIPFDSERKRMSTIHQTKNKYLICVKGASDTLLPCCAETLQNGNKVALTPALREQILRANSEMAGGALRVLGVAYRPLSVLPDKPTFKQIEKDLVFVGLLGMIDPPRPEAKDAIRVAQAAGLRTVMVTGDFKETARAIGSELGLISAGQEVITGAELDKISDRTLAKRAEKVAIFARVSPEHKVRIVHALKENGEVVAMTGDGVNDAPALKRANIGIAMGITGTDVAKETAAMVLTDDNFASIVSAVEEGRIIYANIRKFVYYLISCNIGEILIIFLALVFGLPIPLQPIQLLWLNLVTDGAPALALGMEKGDPTIMRRPPRRRHEPLVNREMKINVAVQAVAMMAAILGVFALALRIYPDNLRMAQTIAFTTLIVSELIRAFTVRSDRYSVFRQKLGSNRWMLAAVGSSLLLLLAVLYIPFLQRVFGVVPLTLGNWLFITPFFFIDSIVAELLKSYWRGKDKRGKL